MVGRSWKCGGTAPETKKRTAEEILAELGRAVLFFDNATHPVGDDDWDALK